MERTSLEDLLAIKGVVAAGEFGADGKLVRYQASMDMSHEMAAMTARLCAPVNIMFETLAEQLGHHTDMKWLPAKGWAYSGGEWTVAVGGNLGVFVETGKADFNELFRALVGRE